MRWRDHFSSVSCRGQTFDFWIAMKCGITVMVIILALSNFCSGQFSRIYPNPTIFSWQNPGKVELHHQIRKVWHYWLGIMPKLFLKYACAKVCKSAQFKIIAILFHQNRLMKQNFQLWIAVEKLKNKHAFLIVSKCGWNQSFFSLLYIKYWKFLLLKLPVIFIKKSL